MNYIYDGTFEGLLTAIYESYYNNKKPDRIVSRKNFQMDFFSENIMIATDHIKFEKVYNAVRTKISYNALTNAYFVYLSELEECGTMVFDYLRLGFKMGRVIDLHLSDDRVLKVEKLSRKVLGERHSMLGLLRFHHLKSGIFYGPIQPDYNISTLLAPHFAARLPDQNWIIHDVKRKIGVFFDCSIKEWYVSQFDTNQYALMKEDTLYQDLWKKFFHSIAIKNKINIGLQKQHMPSRYWKYLVEKL